MKVYLAGKISKNDWRNRLYDGIAPEQCQGDTIAFETHIDVLPVISFDPWIEVTGPFFLRCDHGCYHGDNSHGVGAVEIKIFDGPDYNGKCAGVGLSQHEVISICKSQIERADMLFALIDCTDCYGTLFEIGYASAIGKPIAIMFSNETLAKDMWFCKENAGIVFIANPQSIKVRKPFYYLIEATQISNLIYKGGHIK